MTQARKRTLLFSLIICIASILLINAALPLHTFEPGKSFPISDQIVKPEAATASDSTTPELNVLLFKGSLSLFLFILAIYFVYLVFRKTTWKQVARVFLILLAVMLFIFILSLINPQQVEITPAAQVSTLEVIPFTYRTEPIQSPPIAWQWIAAIIIFIIIGSGIAYFIFREPQKQNLEDRIAREAQSAIKALHAGNDYRSVILYCYREMSRIIQESANIHRDEAMTVREFEMILFKTNLPKSAVHQLGRLFENARYSKNEPTEQDQQVCLSSLKEIIEYSRSEGNGQ